MAVSDFRDTHSWQAAIDLGPQLVRLAEELPGAEQMGLSLQLRQAMVDLPAAIAIDLLQGGSYTRRTAALRLVAVLDLIDKIYPALDTAETRTAVEKLVERISGDSFGEQTAGAAPAFLPGASSSANSAIPAPAASAAPAVAVTEEEAAPVAEAASATESTATSDPTSGAVPVSVEASSSEPTASTPAQPAAPAEPLKVPVS